MKKSKLNKYAKELLLDPKHQKLAQKVAEENGVLIGSLRINVRRDSENLTLPRYTTAIRKYFDLPKKTELTEDYIDETSYLSKHN